MYYIHIEIDRNVYMYQRCIFVCIYVFMYTHIWVSVYMYT
jgi:hypothetical protein